MKVTGKQYLEFHTDVAKENVDPLFHYLTWGQKEGRRVDISELPPDWDWQKYLAAYKDLRDANLTTQHDAEWHYLTYGYYENRWPSPNPQPQYPIGKLSVLRQWNDHKEAFGCLMIPEGDLVCRYGLDNGGADICLNGVVEKVFPRNESAFKLFKPKGGDIICVFEHYGDIRQRVNGQWVDRFTTGRHEDLMMDVNQTADGTLWAVLNGFDNYHSAIYKSLDKGVTWIKHRDFPNSYLNTLIIDGNEVTITGGIGKNDDEALFALDGTVLYTNPNGNGFCFMGGWKKNGKWALGSWNCTGIMEGYINHWDGQNCIQRVPKDEITELTQPFIHDMEAYKGYVYAIATNDWAAKEGVTAVFRSADLWKWEKVMDIPVPHIINIDVYEKGLLFCGGEHDVSGIVLIYPLEG